MVKKLFSVFFILFIYSVVNAQSVPVLSNFRVENAQKDRVYFDTSVPLSATSATTNGFIISGKSVSSITLNSGATTGHYFRVSTPFTFWDNNTIRYEGGSNMGIYKFDLQYIQNEIQEPVSTDFRYVSTSGSNSNDGRSESSAWRTISHAAANSAPGQTIYVKAGNYGNENVVLNNDGTSTKPIKLVGYQSTPGDNPNLNWSHPTNTSTNSSVMPLLRGAGITNSRGIQVSADNIIIRNLQLDNYARLINGGGVENVIMDNILAKGAVSGGYNYYFPSDTNDRIRLINSVAYNSDGTALIRIYGRHNLIDNCKAIQDVGGVDYYMSSRGFNSIFRNLYMEHYVDSGHTGHGMTLKSDDVSRNAHAEYNLCEKITIKGIALAIEARKWEVKYNVFRDIFVTRNANVPSSGINAITIQGGASENIFDNIQAEDIGSAIRIVSITSSNPESSHLNVIKNCTFKNSNRGVYYSPYVAGQSAHDDLIINNTFYNINTLFSVGGASVSNNKFINNIVHTSNKLGSTTSYSFTSNNFYNCNYSTPSGQDNTVSDPQLVNPGAGDFHLMPGSPAIDKGVDNTNVQHDADGQPRDPGSNSIGAFEDVKESFGSVSPDVTICIGENTTLVASGGDSYLWDNGSTDSSITVDPSETTTYNVVITQGQETESYNILVTVNNIPSVVASDDVTICSGNIVTLTATGEGDFTWSNGATGASIDVSPTSTTTYTVAATNSCSAEATDEVIVTVNPPIGLTVTDDVSICTGESVTLTATSSEAVLWSTGETTLSITVSPASTTTYTVSSSNSSCSEEESVEVTVNNQPSVQASEDQAICSGDSVTLTATGEGNFTWSNGDTGPSIEVSPTSTTTYTVTASNSCSSDASDTVTVTVSPAIDLTVSDDVSICMGESVTLTATSNEDLVWSTGETTSSITVSPSNTTIYTVASSNANCSEEKSIEVTVNNTPSVTASEDVTICAGELITLTATGEGNFTWSNGATGPNIQVSPNSTTVYTVTASNSCSTDATDTVTVTVNPAVELTVSGDTSICAGESVTLTATSSHAVVWSTGETTSSITVSPSSTSVYTVTSDNGNCSASEDMTVTVNTSPTVSASSDQTICEGESVTLTATGVGDFLWSTGETSASITVSPETTTTYSVTASSQGCQSTAVDYVEVVVSESPNLSTTNDVTIEKGESVTLNATGNGSFEWSTGETTSSITVSPLVTTSYTVTLTSGSCSEKNTIVVTVTEASGGGTVVAHAGEDATICKGDEIVLTASGGDTYLWSTGETERSITVDPEKSTVFSVRVTKGDNSDVAYVKVSIDDACSLEATTEMIVYPNPARDMVNVDLIGYKNNINIQLYHLNGSLVYSEDLDNKESVNRINHQIELSRFNKGVYFIRLSNEGKVDTKKIIVL